MTTWQTAVQAVLALRAPGYNARDIHSMASWDYVEAVVQKRQQQSYPSKKLMSFLSFFDEGFFDVYLHEARRGYHILSVRLSSHKQALPLRRLLAAHHAHLVKYLDTWTVAELLP